MLKAEGDEMTFRMGKNLQAARETLNLSPQTAALRIGVAATQVEEWETNHQQPSLAQLVLISQRLGLTRANDAGCDGAASATSDWDASAKSQHGLVRHE